MTKIWIQLEPQGPVTTPDLFSSSFHGNKWGSSSSSSLSCSSSVGGLSTYYNLPTDCWNILLRSRELSCPLHYFSLHDSCPSVDPHRALSPPFAVRCSDQMEVGQPAAAVSTRRRRSSNRRTVWTFVRSLVQSVTQSLSQSVIQAASQSAVVGILGIEIFFDLA